MQRRVNWQNGLILSPEMLLQNDQWHSEARQHYCFDFPLSNNYGLVDIIIDHDLLETGLLKVKKLSFIERKNHQCFDYHDCHLNYDLNQDEDHSGQIKLYVNIYEEQCLEEDIPTRFLVPKLSKEPDQLAQSNFYLCQLNWIDYHWKIDEHYPVMLTLGHGIGFVLLNKITGYLSLISQQLLPSIPLPQRMMVSHMIHSLEFKLARIFKRQLNAKTSDIFYALCDIILAIEPSQSKEYIEHLNYTHHNLKQSFQKIFQQFEQWLQLPKKITQIPLHREANYFVSNTLPKDALSANKWFLIIHGDQAKSIEYWKKSWIKVCAPSRKKTIQQLALTGTNLKQVSSDDFKKISQFYDEQSIILQILPGEEFDRLISEEMITCLSVDERANDYHYTLYYS